MERHKKGSKSPGPKRDRPERGRSKATSCSGTGCLSLGSCRQAWLSRCSLFGASWGLKGRHRPELRQPLSPPRTGPPLGREQTAAAGASRALPGVPSQALLHLAEELLKHWGDSKVWPPCGLLLSLEILNRSPQTLEECMGSERPLGDSAIGSRALTGDSVASATPPPQRRRED